MFLISTFLPPSIETLASALIAPSKLGSETPRFSSKSDKMLRNSLNEFSASIPYEILTKRPEQLSVDEFIELTVLIEENTKLLEEKVAGLSEKQQQLDEKLAETADEEKKLAEKRNKLVAKIDKHLYNLYERIYRSKNQAAVVPADEGHCGGCFTMLPSQKLSELKRGDSIVQCDTCSRILIYNFGKDSE